MRTKPWPIFLLCLLLAPTAHAETVNPCQGKHWLEGPVISKAGEGGDSSSGIGGTGFAPPPVLPLVRKGDGGDEGIGGTGIVGVITGFGSICVGEKEVHYGPDTPVKRDGALVPKAQLALGQMVSVRALAVGDGYTLVAQEILQLHAVKGIASQINESGTSLTVLGQTVRLPAGTAAPDWLKHSLAVSGYRLPDGSIEATRIDVLPEDGHFMLMGTVEALWNGGVTINGQRVQLASLTGGAINDVSLLGKELVVQGVVQSGELLVQSWQLNPKLAYSLPVARFYVQGNVRRIEAGVLNVEGFGVTVVDDRGRMAMPGERMEAVIRVGDDGRLEADRWIVDRGSPGSRPESMPSLRGNEGAPLLPPRLDSSVSRPVVAERPDTGYSRPRPDIVRPERMSTFATERLDQPSRPPRPEPRR